MQAFIAEQRSDPTARALDPALDIGALAQAYRLNCRLQIRDFLTPDSARALSVDLHRLPYGLTYNDGERTIELSARAACATSNVNERLANAVAGCFAQIGKPYGMAEGGSRRSQGAEFGVGATVAGPAIIELPTTTVLILAGQTAETDEHGNFLVEAA